MAPPAAAPARRPSARPQSRPAPVRRPPLRVFQPAGRRRTRPRLLRRSTVWLSSALVVGSLFAVVVGDDLVAQGQVHLSATQQQVAAAVTAEKSLQVAVAAEAAPPVVVSQAKSQGMVLPTQVVYLPQVSLEVPLPAPQTAPLPATR